MRPLNSWEDLKKSQWGPTIESFLGRRRRPNTPIYRGNVVILTRVEVMGLEPTTSTLQRSHSSQLSYTPEALHGWVRDANRQVPSDRRTGQNHSGLDHRPLGGAVAVSAVPADANGAPRPV